MSTVSRRAILGLGTGAVSVGVLSACGIKKASTGNSTSSAPASGAGTGAATSGSSASGAAGTTTISVAAYAPGSDKAAISAYEATAKSFMAANPSITVQGKEWTWDAATFASQLAGGTLPTQFAVPFTDGKRLVSNGQVFPLASILESTDWASKLNERVAEAGKDASGKLQLIPYSAYGVGLTYNRTLFQQAGLDPNNPPSTWADVMTAAKTIADKTGQAGYAQMTSKNCGGWMLASMVYTLGGSLESGDGKKATIDTPEIKKCLQMLQQMRWADNSMGSNVLYDWGSINQAFSAGRVGMFMGGSDLFGPMTTQNQMPASIYGLTVLPQEGSNAGFLAGGALATIAKNSTEEQAKAAVKWVEYSLLKPMLDEQSAVTRAKADAAAKTPVGVPGLPVFDKATWEQQQQWIKPYVNVPLDQFKPYTDKIFDLKLTPEPVAKTQEVYAALDPLVQAVLTKKGADIDALTAQYQKTVQTILDKA